MSNWRLVDVDHFMKGNTFFNKLVSELDWHKDFEARCGSVDARVKNIKEPDQYKEALDFAKIFTDFINLKEPRSNRGLEGFKSKDELEAEKKAAKERAQALQK